LEERFIAMSDKKDIINGPQFVSSSASGETPVLDRIKELEQALKQVKEEIDKECSNNQQAITLSSLLCILIVLIGFFFAYSLYNYKLPDNWTWQVVYTTAMRITIIVALFSLASFSFSLLRSYLHIYQNNRHRKVIVNSMASLVEAGKIEQRDFIFNKLLEIIVKFSHTGLLSREKDFTVNQVVDNLKTTKKA
jgi:hypothetical protein